MQIIETGRNFGFIILVVSFITILYFTNEGRKGKVREIRRLAAFDAIDESIGRAVEMGRPVHYTDGTGTGGISGGYGALILAALPIFGYMTEIAAKYGARVIASIGQPDTLPLAQDVCRQAFLAAGKPEEFNIDDIHFYSSHEGGYQSGILGLMQRERPACNVMIGAFYADSLVVAESAARVGAINIGGTARHIQLPYLAAVCDYLLIGEEMFCAEAYLTREPTKVSSLAFEDVIKIVGLALMIIGGVAISAGSNAIVNLLTW